MFSTEVTTDQELRQILLLQQENLRGTRQAATERDQGFVTVTHSLEKLKQMHALHPSIIVKDGDALAAYALVMLKACRSIIPELVPMFEILDTLLYKDQPLSGCSFYVMGQVCVDAAYRGRGVFDMLYQRHRHTLGSKYDFVITEIATRNTRSLRAHERVGFKPLHIHRDHLDEWAVVAWDWN